MKPIEHQEIKVATKEWLLNGGFIKMLPEEVICGSYTAFPGTVGAEAPGLSFPALVSGYAPLLSISTSAQGDDSDLLAI